METVNQPTNQPTNKATVGTLASAALGFTFLLSGLIVRNVAPSWYDAEVWAAGQVLVTTSGVFIGMWYTRDRANVIVKVDQ